MNKAVFFDRDGVLNRDNHNITSIKEVELYEHTSDIIAYCRELGFRTFIITNQPVIARGLISESQLQALHKLYLDILLQNNSNAIIDKIYYCPHHPNANLPEYRELCSCRKPKSGMLLKAKEEFDIDLSKSFMIGDRLSDIIAGNLAGCRTVQCLTGKHKEEMIQTDMDIPENIQPDYKIPDISGLIEVIR